MYSTSPRTAYFGLSIRKFLGLSRFVVKFHGTLFYSNVCCLRGRNYIPYNLLGPRNSQAELYTNVAMVKVSLLDQSLKEVSSLTIFRGLIKLICRPVEAKTVAVEMPRHHQTRDL